MIGPARFTISARANGAAAQTAAFQFHALTYNWTRVNELANTPPLQSTTPGLHSVSFHQTSPLVRGSKHPITAYYSIYRPRNDETVWRWPGTFFFVCLSVYLCTLLPNLANKDVYIGHYDDIVPMNFAVPAHTLTILRNKTAKILNIKLASISLRCKCCRFETANINNVVCKVEARKL